MRKESVCSGGGWGCSTGRPWRTRPPSDRALTPVSRTFACQPWLQGTRTCAKMLHLKWQSRWGTRARVLGQVWDGSDERGHGTRFSERHQRLLLEALQHKHRQTRDYSLWPSTRSHFNWTAQIEVLVVSAHDARYERRKDGGVKGEGGGGERRRGREGCCYCCSSK